MNILLIEDDAGLVELITTNLEELGFSVISATTGAEALAHLEKHTPDLMLLDYSLPDINGKELIETLIKQQTPPPPFIITTGQGDERIAVDMMKLGAMDYLIKDMLFLERLPKVVQRVIKEIESDGKLKQAEEALNQSTQLLEASQSIAKLGGWELDIATNNLFWTAETYRIHDTSPDEFNPTLDAGVGYFLPESRRIISNALEEAIENGEGYDLVLETLTTKGRRIDVRTTCVVTLIDGKPTKLTGIFQDITEKKKIELEIVKTKQFYENIIEGVQDGIWVTDKNDVIFYANSAMEKIAGVPRDQIQGNNVLKDFPEETIGEFRKYYIQVKKERKPVWYVIKVKTPAHRDTWQNGWLIPQYENGNYTGVICTTRDVTERKLAEGSVRRLSTAVEQSPSMIAITDTEGKLEYVNPKFTELTGYSSAEAIGQKSNILKSGKQDTAFYNEMWKTVESGKVWRGQFHNKKKNGELFWEAASISAILNESGEVINFIKIGEDITQQKNTEIELKAALVKAMESDRLKSAFLTNMSHEIRTPMNGIIGFVNLLSEPDLHQDEVDKYASIINRSSKRLLTTINDIIDISKIEAGEIVVSASETSLNNMMDELLSFHSPEAKLKGLSLISKPSVSNIQSEIITDSHKLHGILTNLIKNAIKYSEKGSVTFGYFLKDKFIEFYVKDTGIGIPKDRIKAIFNRFEQADIEDTMAFEGSGLGLAISKAYVEMLGGEISVTSDESKGSTFIFTIPYIKKEKKEMEQLPISIETPNPKTKKMNLLIVEDDDVSSEFLKSILNGMFDEIIIVDNGKDAIEICRDRPELDLVLMDIKMPKMDGYTATEHIRKFNKDIIIIAQTAYALTGDYGKAIDSGCNDYVSKPINKDVLFKLINKYMD